MYSWNIYIYILYVCVSACIKGTYLYIYSSRQLSQSNNVVYHKKYRLTKTPVLGMRSFFQVIGHSLAIDSQNNKDYICSPWLLLSD